MRVWGFLLLIFVTMLRGAWAQPTPQFTHPQARLLWEWLIASPPRFENRFGWDGGNGGPTSSTGGHDLLEQIIRDYPDAADEFFSHETVRDQLDRGRRFVEHVLDQGRREATDPDFLRREHIDINPARRLLDVIDRYREARARPVSEPRSHEDASRIATDEIRARYGRVDLRDYDQQRRYGRRTTQLEGEDAPQGRRRPAAPDPEALVRELRAEIQNVFADSVRSALRVLHARGRGMFSIARIDARGRQHTAIPFGDIALNQFQIRITDSNLPVRYELVDRSGNVFHLFHSGRTPRGSRSLVDIHQLDALLSEELVTGPISSDTGITNWRQHVALTELRARVRQLALALGPSGPLANIENLRTDQEISRFRETVRNLVESPVSGSSAGSVIGANSAADLSQPAWRRGLLYLGGAVQDQHYWGRRGLGSRGDQLDQFIADPLALRPERLQEYFAQRPVYEPTESHQQRSPARGAGDQSATQFRIREDRSTFTNPSGENSRAEIFREFTRPGEAVDTLYVMVDPQVVSRDTEALRRPLVLPAQLTGTAALRLQGTLPVVAIQGVIPIPSAHARRLQALQLRGEDGTILRRGVDFDIFYSRVEDGYFVRLRNPDANPSQGYLMDISFGDSNTRPMPRPPRRLRIELASLNLARLRELSNDLRRSGLIPLADAIERRISVSESHGVPLTMRQLEAIFQREGRYSLVPEASSVPVSARGSRFEQHARFLDSTGRHCVVCQGAANLLTDFVSAYFEDNPEVAARPFQGFSGGEGSLRFSDLHRWSVLQVAGQSVWISDTTPTTQDARNPRPVSQLQQQQQSRAGSSASTGASGRRDQTQPQALDVRAQPHPAYVAETIAQLRQTRRSLGQMGATIGQRGQSRSVIQRNTLAMSGVLEEFLNGEITLVQARERLQQIFPWAEDSRFESFDRLLEFVAERARDFSSTLAEMQAPSSRQLQQGTHLAAFADGPLRDQLIQLNRVMQSAPSRIADEDAIAFWTDPNRQQMVETSLGALGGSSSSASCQAPSPNGYQRIMERVRLWQGGGS